MLVLRYLAGVMAWMTIISVNLLFMGITLWCWQSSGKLGGQSWSDSVTTAFEDVQAPNSVDKQVWEYTAYVMTAFTAILFVVTLLMISRVKIAVACIKVSSRPVELANLLTEVTNTTPELTSLTCFSSG